MNTKGETDSCGEGTAKPKLIVFDLDYTLWPFWIDTHTHPPFFMKGSKVKDARKKTITHYPDVPQMLEYIHTELQIPMAIASRTAEIEGANQLIQLFGWDKYFKYKEIYPGSKVIHFSKFKEATDISYRSMMFFDDEERNIRDLSREGVHCVFVKQGVSMKLLLEALDDFAKKAKSQDNFTHYFKKI